MAIAKEDIARVREATDIVQVVSAHIALRKVGLRWTGLCPFHAENTPSFSVNATEGLYYCFGCQEKGDVITFLQAMEGLDFVGAVEQLAQKAGIELHYDHEVDAGDRKRRAQLSDALVAAVDFYHEQLLNGADAKDARKYLRSRGYDGELVRQFKLGWAPDEWDALAKSLRVSDDVLKASGLGFVNRRSKQQDAFRARVLFPIFDTRGLPIAFGGRVLPDAAQDVPKYKNSVESPLYVKSKTLYALNWAKSDVVHENQIIVCEGYTDVIAFFQSGIPRAVATCGTSLTEDHVRLMKQFANRVVLAYDADNAGQNAAERMYAWEKKYELEISVANFPDGTDPAEAARKDPMLLIRAVEEAKPFLRFRLDRLFTRSDFRTFEGRARVAQTAAAMVAEHPNEMVRDQYLLDIAARTRLPREQFDGVPQPSRRRTPVESRPQPKRHDRAMRIELEAIRVAIHHPGHVARFFDAVLPEVDDHFVEELLFTSEISRSAFRALLASNTLHDAVEEAEPDAADLLSRLAMEPLELDDDNDASAPYIRLVARTIERTLRQRELDLRAMPDQFAEIVRECEWLRLRSEELRDAGLALNAVREVLTWYAAVTDSGQREDSTM